MLSQQVVALVYAIGLCHCRQTVDYTRRLNYWITSTWGRCIKSGCGAGGTKSRSVWCAHKTGATVPPENCNPTKRPISTRRCFKICPELHRDSEWVTGQWSTCSPISNISVCIPSSGVQTRSVDCVFKQRPILQMLCEIFGLPKPKNTRRCQIKCHEDCVVSAFSPWSPCEDCIQYRYRTVIVPPVNDGKLCPILTDTRTCGVCSNDFYKLRVERFSGCVVNPHFPQQKPTRTTKTTTYLGFQMRKVSCINPSGIEVSHRNCISRFKITDLQTHRTCILPQNCEVSSWLPWQTINASCLFPNGMERAGYMRRRRNLIRLPMGGGMDCPALEDTFRVNSVDLPYCPELRSTRIIITYRHIYL